MNEALGQKGKLVCDKPKQFWFLFILLGYLWPSLAEAQAIAQITPDGTLPNNSIVTPDGNVIRIEGGSQAGGNLFHSFSEFSIPTGTEAFFNNPLNIENIITRVTGGQLSNIDGLIRANGGANLFLLNPAGIAFGPGARLNIGGSFISSSADRMLFGDGSFYSAKGTATDSNTAPLLTISVPVGLQYGASARAISVNNTGVTDIVPTDNFGLAVAPGQTLALVGGDVSFSGAIVTAPSGRIEIGSVAEGQVDIVQNPTGFQLNYDNVSEFGNIQLSNRSSLFSPALFGNPNSGINVAGGNIVLTGSQIVALTNGNAKSGDITIRASESLSLGGTIASFPFSSWIANQVAPGATGDSGNVTVTATELSIDNGARIETLSQGDGAAGNVRVEATESIRITGFALPPFVNLDLRALDLATLLEQNTNSRIASQNFASGAGGDVSISTGNLTFLDGGQIATSAGFGTGAGGNINVTAETIIAENAVPFNPLLPSGISSSTFGLGEGGDINISTERLTLIDGAAAIASTVGSGRGGDIIVNANNSITGRGVNPALSLSQSGISSFTFGAGNSGDITVSTRQLNFSEGASIGSSVTTELLGMFFLPEGGTGNAGDVNVNADTIELKGNNIPSENTTIVGSVSVGSGDAGDVNISAQRLRVVDGTQISNTTLFSTSLLGEPLPGSGTGNSGNLTVNVSESIEVIGFNPSPGIVSFIGTANLALGGSGDLTVNTSRLILQDGGILGTLAGSEGDAGGVTINVSEIFIDGTNIIDLPSSLSANTTITDERFQEAFFTSAIPTGNTGELTVNASRLTITNGGEVSVEHQGTGNAGRLQINVESLNLDSGGRINARTALGFGGNVEINVADSLQLRNGAQINVEALGGIGDGGNLEINADTIVALENSDIVANAVRGNGGNIQINTRGIFGTEFRPSLTPKSDITASSRLGVDGTVEINTPDTDPTSGLFELASSPSDPSDKILSGCAADEGNEFYIIGRGGIPDDPLDTLRRRAIWRDLRAVTPNGVPLENQFFEPKPQPEIIEATGWIVNADGSVELVARPNASVGNPWYRPADCGDLQAEG